ncbi:hypothetical protein BJ165DRAFT_1591284 [Panaeolus papilionaceus]|nr:hypothetical protein BJ165DRAFT_1591284 [Panaeolus papilionaceus]
MPPTWVILDDVNPKLHYEGSWSFRQPTPEENAIGNTGYIFGNTMHVATGIEKLSYSLIEFSVEVPEGKEFIFDNLSHGPSDDTNTDNALIGVGNDNPNIQYIGSWTGHGGNQITSTIGSKAVVDFTDSGDPHSFLIQGSQNSIVDTRDMLFFDAGIIPAGKHQLEVTYQSGQGQTPLCLSFLVVQNATFPLDGSSPNTTTMTTERSSPSGNLKSSITDSGLSASVKIGIGTGSGFVCILLLILLIWSFGRRKYHQKKAGNRKIRTEATECLVREPVEDAGLRTPRESPFHARPVTSGKASVMPIITPPASIASGSSSDRTPVGRLLQRPTEVCTGLINHLDTAKFKWNNTSISSNVNHHVSDSSI